MLFYCLEPDLPVICIGSTIHINDMWMMRAAFNIKRPAVEILQPLPEIRDY